MAFHISHQVSHPNADVNPVCWLKPRGEPGAWQRPGLPTRVTAFGPSSASFLEPSLLAVPPSLLSALPAILISHMNWPSVGCLLREKLCCVGSRSDRKSPERSGSHFELVCS